MNLDRHKWKIIIMIIMIVIYFIVEFIVGQLTYTLALISDSFHMLSDLIALIVGFIASHIRSLPKSNQNTYGWQRSEVIGAQFNSIVLMTLCFTVIIDAINRIIDPHEIKNPLLVFYVGIGGLAMNIIGLVLFFDHSHSHNGVKVMYNENSNKNKVTRSSFSSSSSFQLSKSSMHLKGLFLHVLADALGSVIVVASAAIIYFSPGDIKGDGKWKIYVDPCMSILLVILISPPAINLCIQSTFILMQAVPKGISVEKLSDELEKIDGVLKIHDLHVWNLQEDCIVGTVHVRCKNLGQYLKASQEIKTIFHNHGIHCSTIQPEFSHTDKQLVTNFYENIKQDVQEQNESESCIFSCREEQENCIPIACCET